MALTNPDIEILQPLWGYPRSFIAAAKKHGVLVGAVRVVPNSFTLDGHLIEIDEAWLQSSSFYVAPAVRYKLHFTLKVDGVRNYGNLPNVDCPSWGTFLIFAEEATKYLHETGRWPCRNAFEGMKAYFSSLRSEYGWIIVHTWDFVDTIPESIRLRVGRRTENRTEILTEEVLTFELPSIK
jgi:hypothetical protein